MSTSIKLQHISEHVFEIQIDRPEKKNALTSDMYNELANHLIRAQHDDQINVVILTGVSGAFSTGNDIADFVAQPPLDESAPVWKYFSALMGLEKPLIAAVDGMAIGAGATTLLHCDLVYATPTSTFTFPFASVGLTPEGLSSLFLPLSIGRQRTSALLLAGEKLTANKAIEYGFANEIVESDQLLPHAKQKAAALARLSPDIVKKTKRLIAKGMEQIVAQQFAEEKTALANAIQGPSAQMFFEKFLSQRKV